MQRFRHQIAAVTGASGAVGSAVSAALAAEGARLCLLGRSAASLESVSNRLAATGVRIDRVLLDLREPASVETAAMVLLKHVPGVDIIVHCAGLVRIGGVDALSDEDVAAQFAVNLTGPYDLTRRLLPSLRARGGQVVFINSTAASNPRGELAPYTAAKLGLKAIADCLRAETNEAGVRVTSVHIGRTASAMQRYLHESEGKAYHPRELLQADDVASCVLHALKLPATAEITDLYLRPFVPPSRR